MIKMTELPLAGQRVLIREDLNVPIKDGKVASDARIRAALPTIEYALKAGAKVMVMSHLGRPHAGEFDPVFSLQPVADCLANLLGCGVSLMNDIHSHDNGHAHNNFTRGNSVVLLENVRFNVGETTNDAALSRAYAALCDVFVMDAFGSAHRRQASTYGVARYAPMACAGPLLCRELEVLDQALANPARPVLAIVGGAKISSKLKLLNNLSKVVDQMIVGGGIANTFLAASGQPVGDSLYEPDFMDQARTLLNSHPMILPQQVITAKTLAEDVTIETKASASVAGDDKILDIVFSAAMAEAIKAAKTIVWNGPLGAFEYTPFSQGTRLLSEAIAASDAFSLAGGGDTVAAIERYGIKDKVSYITTGGGAFLASIEGETLPAVEMLEARVTKA